MDKFVFSFSWWTFRNLSYASVAGAFMKKIKSLKNKNASDHKKFFKELTELFQKHNFSLHTGIHCYLRTVSKEGKVSYYPEFKIDKDGNLLSEHKLIYPNKKK
jgi:hypothetical protein